MHVRQAILGLALITSAMFAAAGYSAQFVRITADEERIGEFEYIVQRVAEKTGLHLSPADFKLDESRDLAFNHYKRYSQMRSGVRIKNMGIRLWAVPRRLMRDRLVLAEANVEGPQISGEMDRELLSKLDITEGVRDLTPVLTAQQTRDLVLPLIKQSDDHFVRSLTWQDYWQDGALIREVVVTGKRGKHTFVLSTAQRHIIKHSYAAFPNSDLGGSSHHHGELRAKVYPVYEEYRGIMLPRQDVVLKNLLSSVTRPESDPFAVLRERRYLFSKYDPIAALTPEGRAAGFWSEFWLSAEARRIAGGIPKTPNTFADGFLLQGKFTTINIHPDAFKKFSGVDFEPKLSAHFFPRYQEVHEEGLDDEELIPGAAFLGKPLLSADEAYERVNVRDPQHDPATYMNAGFDEVQVYYAVNQLFESLRSKGFADPELSTRPFHAILFNPDISLRNNAYYTSDTINFTTYAPEEINYARDNLTIWHELGHGIMDRLMGDFLTLADTGGLSEGMADFVAALVLQDVTSGQEFPGYLDQRIINKTGFFLTNEVHDDGEAYGGVMKDILDLALRRWGHAGLVKMTDLTLESMRLSRDHPGLTAEHWFNNMLYADRLGRGGLRRPGELRDLIQEALASRNFTAADKRALFSLQHNGKEITAEEVGSRDRPMPIQLQAAEAARYDLAVKLQSSGDYKFSYPLEVKVYLRGGPIQGAIHWEGEEQEFVSYTVNSDAELMTIPLSIRGTCDEINRDDGSCVDYAYVQVWDKTRTTDKPIAKKRFYLRLKTKA